MANADSVISAKHKEIFKQTFDKYDLNKDGHITVDELITVLKELGHKPTEEQQKEIIKAADIDGNGKLEFNEFCIAVAKIRKQAFDAYDTDGSGFITATEYVEAYKKLDEDIDEEHAKMWIGFMDKNSDGKISYDEFVEAMKNRGLY